MIMVCGSRSVRSQAAEDEALSHHEATSPPQMPEAPPAPPTPSIRPAPPVSSTLVIQPASLAEPHADIISQLLPTLLAVQQVLQKLAQNQATSAPVPAPVLTLASPAIEPVQEELAQGVTPNADIL